MSSPAAFHRRILFIQGKGGVGKTSVSRAIAEILTEKMKQQGGPHSPVLLVQIDDPRESRVEVVRSPAGYYTLNATVNESFLEYAGLKLKSPKLARFLLDHKLITYLVEAAPGIKELALVGKIWYETRNYSTVIVDMPSTGHAITLFQAFRNWADLFENSPIAKDAAQIEADFGNPEFAGHVLLALPEEMPLSESEELRGELEKLYPGFSSLFLVNRVTPKGESSEAAPKSTAPYSKSAKEHFARRRELEAFHLKSVANRSPKLLTNQIPGEGVIEGLKEELRPLFSPNGSA